MTRLHYIKHPDGTMTCQYTPPATVRSFAEVGGVRDGRKYTRRLNRQARARGFSAFKSFVQFIAAHRQINQTEAFKYVHQAFR